MISLYHPVWLVEKALGIDSEIILFSYIDSYFKCWLFNDECKVAQQRELLNKII